jgi:hypothetical protein
MRIKVNIPIQAYMLDLRLLGIKKRVRIHPGHGETSRVAVVP